MKSSKISVIIPSYNPDPDQLVTCLKAINLSSLKPYEVILVDDNSTINYFDKIRPYCKIIKNKENRGPAYTRNRGAKEAKGNILCFIDSDVLIKFDTLEKISKRFSKEISAVQTIYTKTTSIPNFSSQYQNLHGHYIFRVIKHRFLNSISSHCIAIRRNAFFDVGGFDEDVKNLSVEDEHLGIALSSKGHKILLDKSIQVEHLAYFNLKKILKRMFRIAKGKIIHTIKKPETRKMKLKKTQHPMNFIISIFIAPLILLFLIASPFIKFFSLTPILLFLLINFKFFGFICKNKGLTFMFKSIFVYYLVCSSIFLGFIKGGIASITR